MMFIPKPDLNVEVFLWSPVAILGATILLESENQPDEGQVAVGYVVKNRAEITGKKYSVIALARSQFSCWNEDYRAQAMERLAHVSIHQWERATKHAAAVHWAFAPDPTRGATFYLNPKLTRKIRGDGTLPPWWDIDGDPMTEVVIADHAFRCSRRSNRL